MNSSVKRVVLLAALLVLALIFGACVEEPDGVVVEEPVEVIEEGVVEEEVIDAGEPLEDELGEEPLADPALFGEFGVTGIEIDNVLASNLLGFDILNTDGETIGEIEDLLIDLETGNVLVARVEHGGFLDIGDEDIAVPLRALQWSSTVESFVLTVNEALFDTWPVIDDEWPDPTDVAWDTELTTIWTDVGLDLFWNREVEMAVMWVTTLIGYDDQYGVSTDLGTIEDLVVDLSQSRAPYMLVLPTEQPGTLELRAVPFNAFEPELMADELVLFPVFGPNVMEEAPLVLFDPDLLEQSFFLAEGWDEALVPYWQGFDVSIAPGALE